MIVLDIVFIILYSIYYPFIFYFLSAVVFQTSNIDDDKEQQSKTPPSVMVGYTVLVLVLSLLFVHTLMLPTILFYDLYIPIVVLTELLCIVIIAETHWLERSYLSIFYEKISIFLCLNQKYLTFPYVVYRDKSAMQRDRGSVEQTRDV